ncbi:MAG: DUF1501 domain-containing protein [Planctomycetaceae bacterium]
MSQLWSHPALSRRTALQAGAVGLLGLNQQHLSALRAASGEANGRVAAPKAVIYIFLSGGLGQLDSFDMKPNAPAEVRGEFNPVATATPGLWICEHLPRLAARSRHWSLVRSLTHPFNEHSDGHMVMLAGRSQLPPTFNRSKPMPDDWPSLAAVAGDRIRPKNNLPPAIVLPEKLIHRTGRTIPGQFAGQMGPLRDPWFVEMQAFNGATYGAFPQYEFSHADGAKHNPAMKFDAPNLSLPEDLVQRRVLRRLEVLQSLEHQQRGLEQTAMFDAFDRHREAAVSLLTGSDVRAAFDVTRADEATQLKYGKHSFGWSLLMASRLVEAGVSLVQVNLGNNETWDTHGNAFPNLKEFLYPPMDQAVSALLDDLSERGLLDSTLVVMAGEFGRTPKVLHLTKHYKTAGRDHWGGAQSVLLAGGGVGGGRVIGSTDKIAAYPATDAQTPENLAATIYSTLGIPAQAHWQDTQGRPHFVYHGTPIAGLS